MTFPGLKPSYSNLEESRWDRSKHVPSRNISRPEAIEAGSAFRIDSVRESAKAPNTLHAKYLERMALRVEDKIVLVCVRDILWIQSHRNLLWLYLQGARYEHRMTIKDICTRLDPDHFLRVHRNAIVNLDHVMEFDLPRCGNAFVHLRNGKTLPISRTGRLVLRRSLLSQSYASAGTDDS
jgi:DNA-binding LytR/AlgR family response regulator